MKLVSMLVAIFAVLSLILATSCFTVVLPGSSSTATGEPLAGSWQMTRLSISPQVPLPDVVLSQVIPQKATWTISRVGGKLTIDYGGKDTWYNTLGIPVQKKQVQVTEGSDNKSCTFKGGGIIQMQGLPTLLSSAISASVQNITVDFSDSVDLTLSPDGTLSAKISVQAGGKYFSGSEQRTFSQSGTVTYRGTRK
ncbi:MAG: hypothetical protein FJ008_06920 [Chloroflexi bacterium]|nr:hypothetical protein [Chloroflexota bacterium]MBM3155053.1 hypothetical protein [Chloroflexota bacterium]MBM3173503.1 hypothetical protein [Chloroflexota bacterium]MBM3175814.1 hypothetical protein [Chloroflexota bacterium]MBM4450434.1 hypothetical protein [Chloroflexota bacterium]